MDSPAPKMVMFREESDEDEESQGTSKTEQMTKAEMIKRRFDDNQFRFELDVLYSYEEMKSKGILDQYINTQEMDYQEFVQLLSQMRQFSNTKQFNQILL